MPVLFQSARIPVVKYALSHGHDIEISTMDIIIHGQRLRVSGFDGDGGETQLSDSEFKQTVSKRKELVRAVGCLAEGHNSRLADHALQRLKIGKVVTRF